MKYLIVFLSLLTTGYLVGSSPFVCRTCTPVTESISCCQTCTNQADKTYTTISYTSCTGCDMVPTGFRNCANCALDHCLLKVYRFTQVGTGDHYYSQNGAAYYGTDYGPEAPLGLGFSLNTLPDLPLAEVVGYMKQTGAPYNHFYTSDNMEGSLYSSQGWTMGGTIAWIFMQQWPDTYPVYRYQHTGSNLYLMTMNTSDIGTGGFWSQVVTMGYMYRANYIV